MHIVEAIGAVRTAVYTAIQEVVSITWITILRI